MASKGRGKKGVKPISCNTRTFASKISYLARSLGYEGDLFANEFLDGQRQRYKSSDFLADMDLLIFSASHLRDVVIDRECEVCYQMGTQERLLEFVSSLRAENEALLEMMLLAKH